LYTTIETPDRLRIPRDGVSAIYIQILADLDLAATYLPIQYGAADVGRATQGAAMALAAKINIYQKNWTKALEYIAKVKSLNVYALVTDYADNFRKNTQNNAESVWEIQHTNLELGVGNSINQWWYSKKIVGGYGFAEVTASFVASFEVDDPRRKNTIVMNNEDYFGVVYKNSFSSTRYSPRKYLQADSTVTQKADGDINYTAIRYAEVLLWEAEALTALDRTAEAIVPLEVVRARARKLSDHPLTALPKVTTTDKQIMTAAIRHERQVELGLEMHRFFDLVRWGTASTTLPGFQAGKHEVFPLPQIEIDLNTKLIQNPGY
ncbi:MAG: RagB/SusD family nutrient uptake outer membrane protein, partial [Saprospiraceae bacterium]